MTVKKTGTAVVTTETRFVPIAYDGDCCSEPVAEPTVEGVLKSGFDFKPGYLGFKFAQAIEATIELEDGTTLSFKKERSEAQKFYIADEVVTAEVYMTDARFAKEFATLNPYYKEILQTVPETLIYFQAGKPSASMLQKSAQENVAFINRQGKQLWPAKKVPGVNS